MHASKEIFVPVLALIVVYVLIVRLLRYRRVQDRSRVSLPSMTVSDAHETVMILATLEFPTTFINGIRFGMFKSYAIPTVTAILSRTGYFDNAESASRRAADTGALLAEIFFHSPGSHRALTALARTNFLHSGYRKSGHITNDDMLYTLALSVLAPLWWIEKYEWRSLTKSEINAMAIWWKYLGECIHISYSDLSQSEWQDGLEWLDDLREWTQQYEERAMRSAESNHQVASNALKLLSIPEKLVVQSFLENDRSDAMGVVPVCKSLKYVIQILLLLRAQTIRLFCLPRVTPVKMTAVPNTAKPGYFWTREDKWSLYPWYVHPTVWSRYGPSTWLRWCIGKPNPGDEGDKFCPDGFRPDAIGPKSLRCKGKEFSEKEYMWLLERTACGQGCPFLK